MFFVTFLPEISWIIAIATIVFLPIVGSVLYFIVLLYVTTKENDTVNLFVTYAEYYILIFLMAIFGELILILLYFLRFPLLVLSTIIILIGNLF